MLQFSWAPILQPTADLMFAARWQGIVAWRLGDEGKGSKLDFIHFQRCLLNANPVNAVY